MQTSCRTVMEEKLSGVDYSVVSALEKSKIN